MALSLLLGSACANVMCGDEEGTVLSSFQGAENMCDVYGVDGNLGRQGSTTIGECGKRCADHAECMFYSWWGSSDVGDTQTGWCEISATCNNRGTQRPLTRSGLSASACASPIAQSKAHGASTVVKQGCTKMLFGRTSVSCHFWYLHVYYEPA